MSPDWPALYPTPGFGFLHLVLLGIALVGMAAVAVHAPSVPIQRIEPSLPIFVDPPPVRGAANDRVTARFVHGVVGRATGSYSHNDEQREKQLLHTSSQQVVGTTRETGFLFPYSRAEQTGSNAPNVAPPTYGPD